MLLVADDSLKVLLDACIWDHENIDTADQHFFEVVDNYPEKMVQARPSHVQPSRTMIRIRLLKVILFQF